MKAAEIPGNTELEIWRGVSSPLTCRVFVATEYGFGQALGNPQPSPSRKGLEYRSVTVEFVIVAEVIRLPADERTRLLSHSTRSVRLLKTLYPAPTAPTSSIADCSAAGHRLDASAASYMLEMVRRDLSEIIPQF